MRSFRDAIDGRISLLLDGVTGTELYRKGVFMNRCFEESNLADPSLAPDLALRVAGVA